MLAALSADERATLDHLEMVRAETLVILRACREAQVSWAVLQDTHGTSYQALQQRMLRASSDGS